MNTQFNLILINIFFFFMRYDPKEQGDHGFFATFYSF